MNKIKILMNLSDITDDYKYDETIDSTASCKSIAFPNVSYQHKL